MDWLLTCKVGFEKILVREILLYGLQSKAQGASWVLAEERSSMVPGMAVPTIDWCFACDVLEQPQEIPAASVNGLVDQLVNVFLAHLGDRRLEAPWDFAFLSADGEALARHTKTVEERWHESLRKRMSRVARLARRHIPTHDECTEGFFVHISGFHQARVSFKAFSMGQRRMKDDPRAPSRSYLKVEEAFQVFRQEPHSGDLVVDLGAAPGGWSYSALRRGARVIAVDNGPLREPVKSHPKMQHLVADAFKYEPDDPANWLLCDVLDKPEIVLGLLQKWAARGWCRFFIVNLKVGRLDPVVVLRDIRDIRRGILPHCQVLMARQLYHDREEITLMGQVK